MEDDLPPPSPADESGARVCPNCGHAVESTDPAQTLLKCPACGEEFFVGSEGDEEVRREEAEARAREEEAAAQRELDLSEAKIRQISNLRRGAFRTRSWLIIAAITCVAGAAQLVFMAVQAHRRALRGAAIRDVVLAIACLFVCRYVMTRVRRLTREIEQSRLEEPTAPPDFSTLSDGSQRWKNLENMTGTTTDDSAPQP
jgi:uncharacterized Zn finger protein (UPF0148 family)